MLNGQRSTLNDPTPHFNSSLLKIVLFIAFFCLLALHSAAQDDSLKLSCLLNEKIEPAAERKPNSIGAEDLKAAWISRSDTVVKACINGMVTVILHDADGKWELMFNHDQYTFWYSGLSKLNVDKGQKIKMGEPVGYTRKGEKIILQMMDSETSIDPKEFLDCGK